VARVVKARKVPKLKGLIKRLLCCKRDSRFLIKGGSFLLCAFHPCSAFDYIARINDIQPRYFDPVSA